jgi:hypothetical protein
VAWEIALLRDRGALTRTVFIVHEGQTPNIKAFLNAQLGALHDRVTLLTYRDRTGSEVLQHRAVIAACLGNAQKSASLGD